MIKVIFIGLFVSLTAFCNAEIHRISDESYLLIKKCNAFFEEKDERENQLLTKKEKKDIRTARIDEFADSFCPEEYVVNPDSFTELIDEYSDILSRCEDSFNERLLYTQWIKAYPDPDRSLIDGGMDFDSPDGKCMSDCTRDISFYRCISSIEKGEDGEGNAVYEGLDFHTKTELEGIIRDCWIQITEDMDRVSDAVRTIENIIKKEKVRIIVENAFQEIHRAFNKARLLYDLVKVIKPRVCQVLMEDARNHTNITHRLERMQKFTRLYDSTRKQLGVGK